MAKEQEGNPTATAAATAEEEVKVSPTAPTVTVTVDPVALQYSRLLTPSTCSDGLGSAEGAHIRNGGPQPAIFMRQLLRLQQI